MCFKTRLLRAMSRTTPGIPSVPEIKAVTGLIATENPNLLPRIFVIQRRAPPKRIPVSNFIAYCRGTYRM
jgi:hypothetical protein